MGLFKNARNVAANAGNAAEGAAAATPGMGGLGGLHAGLTEGSVDPNDPAFAPIEGVDLDGYAKAVAAKL